MCVCVCVRGGGGWVGACVCVGRDVWGRVVVANFQAISDPQPSLQAWRLSPEHYLVGHFSSVYKHTLFSTCNVFLFARTFGENGGTFSHNVGMVGKMADV